MVAVNHPLSCCHALSWEYGGSSFFIYNGDNIVQFQDVIVVTSNYRLGAFRFLGSAALAATTSDHSTGNFGLQNQRQAIWILDNIEAFGGDPSVSTNAFHWHFIGPHTSPVYSC